MQVIDINCDMGEGMANDVALMHYITSANIACGYHAGDEETMKQTVDLCLKHNVKIGAHPSFADKVNFGRKEIRLNTSEIKQLVQEQIFLLQKIAHAIGATLHHVKPHGALYNMAARDRDIASAIADAVRQSDEDLQLYGLSGSFIISEAKAVGLKTKSEVFADRTYLDDGSLTPRSHSGALIDDVHQAVEQSMQMIKTGTVTSISGKVIPIVAETICIHGDGKNAVAFAKEIYHRLTGK